VGTITYALCVLNVFCFAGNRIGILDRRVAVGFMVAWTIWFIDSDLGRVIPGVVPMELVLWNNSVDG
jgi:hypothetical protein